MNQYYTCLNFIRDSIKGAPFVNTITQGTDIIDNVKKNIFPLAHINILNASAPSQSNTFTFEIAVLDIRNVSKVKSNNISENLSDKKVRKARKEEKRQKYANK